MKTWKKYTLTTTILLLILATPIFAAAAPAIEESKQINDKQTKRFEDISCTGNATITIQLPKKGWLHLLGQPIYPCGVTAIIGVVVVSGHASGVNWLQCSVGNKIQTKENFNGGIFQFVFPTGTVKKGVCTISVCGGTQSFPIAGDSVSPVIIL